MTWDTLLTRLPLLLGALVVLGPVITALRFPQRLRWPAALALVLAGMVGAALLALVVAVAFEALSGVLPGLNPARSAAYEPVDAGLFTLFFSVDIALAAACIGQWLYLRSRP